MNVYDVSLDWFGDDSDVVDVEAENIEDAAARVFAEWGPTGWTSATVSDGYRRISIDLEAPQFNAVEW